MATQIEIGKAGEKLAEIYLVTNGHTMLHRNWRHSHYEIDLITIKENLLHFIEVKYRSSAQHSHPEEAVNKKKLRSLFQAIDQYLFLNPQFDNFHLDVLSITEHAEKETEYFLIEDVYL